MCPNFSSQHRINNKCFSWPIFGVTFATNSFVISNSDSVNNFKFRWFRNCLNIFLDNRIISINSTQFLEVHAITQAHVGTHALAVSFFALTFTARVCKTWWYISRIVEVLFITLFSSSKGFLIEDYIQEI